RRTPRPAAGPRGGGVRPPPNHAPPRWLPAGGGASRGEAQEHPGGAPTPPPPLSVVERKEEPERRHARNGQILHLCPEHPHGHRRGDRMQRAGQAPVGDRQHQPHQGPTAGRAAPLPTEHRPPECAPCCHHERASKPCIVRLHTDGLPPVKTRATCPSSTWP